MGEWVGVATGFVQVKLQLQYLVLDVFLWSARCMEVNDMAEHERPGEFVKSTRYLFHRIEGGEIEGLGQTNHGTVLGARRPNPLLFPRLLRGTFGLNGPLHSTLKVRVSLDRAVECFAHRLHKTAEGESGSVELLHNIRHFVIAL